MKNSLKIFSAILLIVITNSCAELGYTNQYGKYVPKKPAFKLKDKTFLFPTPLDTVNIYKKVYDEYMGKPEFSLKDSIWGSYYPEYRLLYYMKFYSKGRVTFFSKRTKFGSQMNDQLGESDLNPNYMNKGYYYYNGKKIATEHFVYGQGYGMYITLDYYLSNSGDSLIHYEGFRYVNHFDIRGKSIYIREKLPADWKKYPIDW